MFSYGVGGASDDAMDSAYLSLRAGIAAEMQLAAQFLAKHTGESFAQQIAKGNCLRIMAFLSRVATQFNVALTPKMHAASRPRACNPPSENLPRRGYRCHLVYNTGAPARPRGVAVP